MACGTDAPAPDIADVADVQSTFGPEFTTTSYSSGIDPSILSQQSLPEGMRFEPAACQEFIASSTLPSDVQGNMAAVSAEGQGNLFFAIAVETSESVPVTAPTDECKQVVFSGGGINGVIEVVDAPQIDDVATVGTHRIYQTTINGTVVGAQTYNYIASFDNFRVIVTANPLVVPGQPPAEVDTNRAKELLVSAVSAIRD